MVKIKNVRPGIFVIPDAEVTLEPGEIYECDEITRQMEKAIIAGHLIKLTDIRTSSNVFEDEIKETNWSDLSAAEAVSVISKETDLEQIKSRMGNEKRKSVLDILSKRQKELKSGDH